ncbi:elongator complex protein 5 isoform X2 [Patagioenas fasciata]|uniref:elongator complex protein 5 isoform X2 n=1 Tax=Patagioenas fasciata TaxID=372321 RepID=UPI003A99DED5
MLEEPLGGLVLVRDGASCEGRSVLRALVTAAVRRSERVRVLLLDAPRERFERGLSPEVARRLEFLDAFQDPLGWMGGGAFTLGGGAFTPGGGAFTPGGGAFPLAGLLGPPPPPQTLVLDSLSWLLLRLPPPRVLQALGGLLGPPHRAPPRVLALLHEDLHPPPLLRALGGGASTQLLLHPPPRNGAPPLARVIARPPRLKDETFTLLPDGTLGPPPPTARTPGSPGDVKGPPRTPGSPGGVPFRLALSAAERAARAALPPPFRIGPHSLGTPDEDPEDPDDDLDV